MIYLNDYHIKIEDVTREVENDLGWFFKEAVSFKSLPEMIQYYNQSPVVANAYELIALKKYMDDYSALNGHHTFHLSHEPLSITKQTKTLNIAPSLTQLFKVDHNSKIPFITLYDHYHSATINANQKPKSKIAFSKDLKRWHPLITRSQLIVNGKATAAWIGVSLVTGE